MIDTEKQLKVKIHKYLKTIPHSKWFSYNPFYGEAGIPDIIGCVDGQFCAIEVKAGNNKPTELQIAKIQELQRAGAITCIAWDLATVKTFINLLNKE